MRALWGRVREVLEGNIHQQMTKAGIFFTATVVLVGLAAFASANNLLFLLLAALLATMLISGFVSRLGLAGLELNLEMPEHLAARRPVPARMILRNRKWLGPTFSLRLVGSEESGMREPLYIPLIPSRATLVHSVNLWFSRRGQHKSNVFWFESRFPFGFTHRRARVRLHHEVLVYPCLDPVPAAELILSGINGDLEARQRGRGSDFYRIRPYVAMESARHVDWRATAHTGDLQIREFAREEEQAVTVFMDLHLLNDAGETWFEAAVDCCAYLVWQLSSRGTPVRLRTQQFDRRVPSDASVYDVLRYLALVQPLFGAKILTPDDKDLPVAITARPQQVSAAGWVHADLPASDNGQPGAESSIN